MFVLDGQVSLPLYSPLILINPMCLLWFRISVCGKLKLICFDKVRWERNNKVNLYLCITLIAKLKFKLQASESKSTIKKFQNQLEVRYLRLMKKRCRKKEKLKSYAHTIISRCSTILQIFNTSYFPHKWGNLHTHSWFDYLYCYPHSFICIDSFNPSLKSSLCLWCTCEQSVSFYFTADWNINRRWFKSPGSIASAICKVCVLDKIILFLSTELKVKIDHGEEFLMQTFPVANAPNVSCRNSLPWPISIINSVKKTKLLCNISCNSSTVSLATYPLYSFIYVLMLALCVAADDPDIEVYVLNAYFCVAYW